MSGREPDEWFRRSFDERYLALYAHRDEREAETLAATLSRAGASGPALEVGCGAGRFLAALAARGVQVTGLDLSSVLLSHARRRLGADAGLIQGDMRRLPCRDEQFRLALFLFTSFGYFADLREDRAAFGEAVRVLAVGGFLLLDFLNAPRATARLVPESRRRVGSLEVRETRWVDPSGPFLRKRTIIEEQGREEVTEEVRQKVREEVREEVRAEVRAEVPEEVREERVRLYMPDELMRLAEEHGLVVLDRWGDYEGTPFRPEESDRFLLWARKETR